MTKTLPRSWKSIGYKQNGLFNTVQTLSTIATQENLRTNFVSTETQSMFDNWFYDFTDSIYEFAKNGNNDAWELLDRISSDLEVDYTINIELLMENIDVWIKLAQTLKEPESRSAVIKWEGPSILDVFDKVGEGLTKTGEFLWSVPGDSWERAVKVKEDVVNNYYNLFLWTFTTFGPPMIEFLLSIEKVWYIYSGDLDRDGLNHWDEMELGGTENTKDLFIEIDYMTGLAPTTSTLPFDPGSAPNYLTKHNTRDVLQYFSWYIETYSESEYGEKININIIIDDELEFAEKGLWKNFNTIKSNPKKDWSTRAQLYMLYLNKPAGFNALVTRGNQLGQGVA